MSGLSTRICASGAPTRVPMFSSRSFSGESYAARQDLRRDLRRVLRRDVRRDLRRELRCDVRRDLRRDLRRACCRRSWGDNELSPECLDGAMRYLKPAGISIPADYTSFAAPLSSSKLWNEVRLIRTYDKSVPIREMAASVERYSVM